MSEAQSSMSHPSPQDPSQQLDRSGDMASHSFPQQTDQTRLQSQPVQTTPVVELAPAVQRCGKCNLQMKGSFVRALGSTYHLDCFKCMDCGQIVASKFFPITEPDGKQYPLCERDYFRRLNLVCQSCGGALRGSYITALDYKYHIEHFTCSVCPTVFGPKDSYYEHDGKVYCHYHYSLCYAVKCAGCRTAILKQFVEINRNSQDEHWHPECYMIHKFWNVKLSSVPQKEDLSQDEADPGSQPEGTEFGAGTDIEFRSAVGPGPTLERRQIEIDGNADPAVSDREVVNTTASPGEDSASSVEIKTPEELKLAQQQMEEKVYQIWTVLSAFEESSAGCISDMLLHVSNGAYYEGVLMAGRFILHVDILFSAIDDLEAQMKEVGDKSDMAHGREAKMLCKKIVNFFSLLSHTQESGVRRLGMTQELLSLVTGLAHYLKILIRIALTSALKLERQYDSPAVIARFLNKLVELANRDKCTTDLHGKQPIDAEVTSDLCLACRVTIEDECFTFNHNHRWHPKCLNCSKCAASQASIYYDASFDPSSGQILCSGCKTAESQIGFLRVTKLEQYTFLLRVALIRLENLLHLKGDDLTGTDQRNHQLATSPTLTPLSPPGLIRNDSRSKSYSADDNRQYEPIHLGDIKRVKSTHLDRKLSNSARIPRRQTVIERQRRQPATKDAIINELAVDGNVEQDDSGGTDAEVEIIIVDERPGPDALNHEEEEDREGPDPNAPATLSDLPERLRNTTSNTASTSSSRNRHSNPSQSGQQPEASNTTLHPKRQYLSELSALELFIVKHLAVLTLAPIVSEYFTLEELLDLIGQRKQTLWGRFVKGLKTDKKKPKVEGTFGVPLEVLVERNGVDSALGAGPGRIRIPSFVDESITAMRNMDMSVEGVFRKNGNIRRLKELSESIDKNPSSVTLSDDNPVQVAALLKKFLRDLPDPLLTFKLHRLFVVSQKMEDESIRKTILHLTCCLLPKPNRDSMEAICIFLRWVASFSHVDEETGSKMDLHNLATVITPNVLYSKSKDPTKDESFLAIEAVMGLLEYQEEFCVVPMDLSSILSDQDLVESSTDLSSKDILKRCENLVRSKIKKSHSFGDLYGDSNNSSRGEGGDLTSVGQVNCENAQLNSSNSHGPSTTSAIRIPERPRPYHHSHSSQAIPHEGISNGGRERGSTPMSL
ncbi:hypothetical protein BCR41DRAFT_420754 [Lobosporangium transversale]|uniref:Uncharacterized protein n=1 Tax=Lobosporangium transversale TaxID=64571 RepID=A0A1Y2GWU7_9FUNG|nr:hypothetical protein BCR41DRAFT_420754 [Lobosporangium transversale]ORZ21827.1 hypothetical protein BCR41DRAFT_420754 [Lobosporangium transversale]|eukprot:XP_021883078.1 hypothetical protein BCR41DRAFT_420754 [Lobosporangium transversale]